MYHVCVCVTVCVRCNNIQPVLCIISELSLQLFFGFLDVLLLSLSLSIIFLSLSLGKKKTATEDEKERSSTYFVYPPFPSKTKIQMKQKPTDSFSFSNTLCICMIIQKKRENLTVFSLIRMCCVPNRAYRTEHPDGVRLKTRRESTTATREHIRIDHKEERKRIFPIENQYSSFARCRLLLSKRLMAKPIRHLRCQTPKLVHRAIRPVVDCQHLR